MTIVYEKLLALEIPEVEQSYGPKDCMLYALGVGLGHDPTNEDELAYVYEKSLKVLPTMAVVIGSSAVLEDGVSIPRRTRLVIGDPVLPEFINLVLAFQCYCVTLECRMP